MLTVKNLTIFSQKKKIIDGFTFTFQKGRIYALMGPNGSGKSTLAQGLMGNPAYSFSKNSQISFQKTNIKNLKPEKRAKLGLFLSFQSPLALSGVSVLQLLRTALAGQTDVLKLQGKITALARELKIPAELLSRSLNEGFSGGERKKMEVLQALALDPQFLIFDEIDTGADIDSLKLIGQALRKLKKQGKALVVITHYNRILKYLRPDQVLIVKDGRLVKTGPRNLVRQIEIKGYSSV